MADQDLWFISRHRGKASIVHWKGAIIVAVFFAVAITGAGIESALKRDHPIWEIVALAPLAALVWGLAWTIAVRTKRD